MLHISTSKIIIANISPRPLLDPFFRLLPLTPFHIPFPAQQVKPIMVHPEERCIEPKSGFAVGQPGYFATNIYISQTLKHSYQATILYQISNKLQVTPINTKESTQEISPAEHPNRRNAQVIVGRYGHVIG